MDSDARQPIHGGLTARALRDVALLAGVTLDRLRASQVRIAAAAVVRAPRAVLIAAGVAAAAAVAAFVHFTGFVPSGAAGALPQALSASDQARLTRPAPPPERESSIS